MVKARVSEAGIKGFGPPEKAFNPCPGDGAGAGRRPEFRLYQGRGTIDAPRETGGPPKSDDDRRSNSIRRSAALERIRGNLSNTLLRMLG